MHKWSIKACVQQAVPALGVKLRVREDVRVTDDERDIEDERELSLDGPKRS